MRASADVERGLDWERPRFHAVAPTVTEHQRRAFALNRPPRGRSAPLDAAHALAHHDDVAGIEGKVDLPACAAPLKTISERPPASHLHYGPHGLEPG
jgi:hypothetical protein